MPDNPNFSRNFPMVIAVTALVVVLVSGIVNYRQNNLASIESGLRDTRDQLQLAKNDIADMKVRTLQKLVEAELTIRNRDRLLDEKDELIDKLSEANIRIKELEEQVKALDGALEKGKKQVKESRKKTVKSKTKAAPRKKTAEKKAVASRTSASAKATDTVDTTAKKAAKDPAVAEKTAASTTPITQEKGNSPEPEKVIPEVKAAAPKQATAIAVAEPLEEIAKATAASAELDIYTQKIAPSLQQSIADALAKVDFKATFPDKRKSMKMTKETTVFYYDKSYKPVAEQLVQHLTDITKSKVILRKGASPFGKNKIIAHIIAD